MKICKETKPEELSGTILAIPVLSTLGFNLRTPYVNPMDGINVSRAFPGKPDGTMSERIMHLLVNELLPISDFRLDLHGGDYDERLNPNTYFAKTGNKEHDKTAETLARIYGFRYVIERKVEEFHSTTTVVPSIIAECGGIKTLHKQDMEQHLEGIKNVLKFYNMITGKPRIRVKQLHVTDFGYVKTSSGGLFYPIKDIDDQVKKGEKIGEIWNLWGEEVEELKSPVDGVIRKMNTYHAVNSGETIIQIMKSPKPLSKFPPTDPYVEVEEYEQTSRVKV
jgi:hypothetical protein